jgi:hypothetical protein
MVASRNETECVRFKGAGNFQLRDNDDEDDPEFIEVLGAGQRK